MKFAKIFDVGSLQVLMYICETSSDKMEKLHFPETNNATIAIVTILEDQMEVNMHLSGFTYETAYKKLNEASQKDAEEFLHNLKNVINNEELFDISDDEEITVH